MTFDLLDQGDALDPDVQGVWWAARNVGAIVCLAGTQVGYDTTELR